MERLPPIMETTPPRTEVPVERLTVSACTIPTDTPEADGTLSWDSTTIVVVEASVGGLRGLGWTYGPAACADVVRVELAPHVLGADALNPAAAWDGMVRASRNAPRPGLVSFAVAAVDTALWDLRARLLDLPLARMLGAAHREIPVYGSGGFTTYDNDRTREQLRSWVGEQAIPRVKIKVGESWGTAVDRDVARMRLARDAIGDSAELFVDANGGYTAKQAVRVMERVDDLDVTWLEEPVSSDHLDELAIVRTAVRADVTAGEYGTDLVYFRRMCAAGAVDCLQVDVSRCAGITELMRVTAVADAYGLQVSGHCAPHLHAHPLAACRNLRHLEWFHDHVRIERLLFGGTLEPAGGAIRPAMDRAGNGLEFGAGTGDPGEYRIRHHTLEL